MKRYFWTFLACFGGVFGAMQASRMLPEEPQTDSLFTYRHKDAIPASYTSAVSGVDFRGAAHTVLPSVVSVDRYDNVQRYFNEAPTERESGTGSGVILSHEGLIVTNNHVVEGASKVKVRLEDKRSFTAEVLGTDPRSDLAVLKIKADDLQPIAMGDSKKLEVGEWVLAVGNPLGFDSTVSVGVVSSLGRSLSPGHSLLVNLIQTDAAINQGNSGGALTNAEGELIGINSAIASPTGGSIGIGFAIPADTVKRVVDEIVKNGHVSYGGLGISFDPRDGLLAVPEVQQDLKEQLGATPPSEGILVRSAMPGSGAAKAGIGQFDILLEIDGKKLVKSADLQEIMLRKKPGDQVSVKFWSKGNVKTLKITLQEIR